MKETSTKKGEGNIEYNIFEDDFQSFMDSEDVIPNRVEKSIRFPEEGRVEICSFTPDGRYLANGTKDGVIEIWNPKTYELASDISY